MISGIAAEEDRTQSVSQSVSRQPGVQARRHRRTVAAPDALVAVMVGGCSIRQHKSISQAERTLVEIADRENVSERSVRRPARSGARSLARSPEFSGALGKDERNPDVIRRPPPHTRRELSCVDVVGAAAATAAAGAARSSAADADVLPLLPRHYETERALL